MRVIVVGVRQEQDLYIRLIDSVTKQVRRYTRLADCVETAVGRRAVLLQCACSLICKLLVKTTLSENQSHLLT